MFRPLGPVLLPLFRRRPSQKAWPCAVQAGAWATDGKEWTLVLPELQLKMLLYHFGHSFLLLLHVSPFPPLKKGAGDLELGPQTYTANIPTHWESNSWESGCYFKVSFSPIPLCSNNANWRTEAALAWEPWIFWGSYGVCYKLKDDMSNKHLLTPVRALSRDQRIYFTQDFLGETWVYWTQL